jgi:CO/xanthine dehydrogenase Mo-binding subunit
MKGIGISIGFKSSGFKYGAPEGSHARIVLHGGSEIERAEVHTSCSEVGQGSYTALAQIAAEELDLELARIDIVVGDTADVGDAGMASASRLTLVAGNAIKLAAELAKREWRDEQRPAIGECRWAAPRTSAPDSLTGACEGAFSFAYAAQALELEVDIETGQIELVRVVAVHDPGRTVNPEQATGQVQGGVVQAQGWALLENFITRNGQVETDLLSKYLIPTTMDIPVDFRVIFNETPDPVGPFGARGLGEIPFVPFAPAVVSAVRSAIGEWFDVIPLTPEVVLSRVTGK